MQVGKIEFHPQELHIAPTPNMRLSDAKEFSLELLIALGIDLGAHNWPKPILDDSEMRRKIALRKAERNRNVKHINSGV